MKSSRILVVLSAVFVFSIQVAFAQSDQEITHAIIEQSLASYPGNCPCPYNTDRAGRSCGKRSAYSRAGGYSPLCYPSDVTAEMIEFYHREHGQVQGIESQE